MKNERVRRNGVYQRGRMWWIDYSYHGKRIREPAGQNKTEAKNMLDVRKADILRGEFRIKEKKEKITFQKMADLYLKEKAEKRSLNRDRQSLKLLLPEFGKHRVDHVTSVDIEDYKSRRGKEVSGATCNRELALLRHMLNMAVGEGYLTWNPMKDVKFYKESPYSRRVVYSHQDYEWLWQNAAPHLKEIMIVAVGTGLRKNDLLRLRWDEVNFDEDLVAKIAEKNEELVVIPMTPEVRQTLWAIHETDGKKHKDYVFINRKTGRPYGDIKTAFRAALRRAGLKGRGYKFHDLRRTYASTMYKEGVPLLTVQKLLGHRSPKTTERYLNVTLDERKEAARILSQAWFKRLSARVIDTKQTQSLEHKPESALLPEHSEARA